MKEKLIELKGGSTKKEKVSKKDKSLEKREEKATEFKKQKKSKEYRKKDEEQEQKKPKEYKRKDEDKEEIDGHALLLALKKRFIIVDFYFSRISRISFVNICKYIFY